MFLNSVSERPIMNVMRVRLRVRYMSRNEKLYVNHVKQLKGEIKLLTSTKLAGAGMTKLTLLSMRRAELSAMCH